MNLLHILVVLLITVPLLELYILIKVGGLIGVIPTIMICIVTAITGAAMMRYQGLRTLISLQTKLAQGEFPAQDLLEGVILLVGGMLLFTPGFFTDALGFICLVPTCRTVIARQFGKLVGQSSAFRTQNRPVILEGEYWSEDTKPSLKSDRDT